MLEKGTNTISNVVSRMPLFNIDKEELLRILEEKVFEIGNKELASINQTASECPYIKRWFNYYIHKDVNDIKRAIAIFAPKSTEAHTFNEYIEHIANRVRLGLKNHIKSGSVEDVPPELLDQKHNPEDFAHIKYPANTSIIQYSKKAKESEVKESYEKKQIRLYKTSL